MIKDLDNHRAFLEKQSKGQLIIFLNNKDLIENSLRERLELLSGCPCFGEQDGTNGACVECYYNNRILNERCCVFQESLIRYRDRVGRI